MPTRAWVESSPYVRGDHVAHTGPLEVGQSLAYFMILPEEKGGTDWYVGEVTRLCKPHWADVEFPDGRLWCSVKPSERMARWVALLAPPSPLLPARV